MKTSVRTVLYGLVIFSCLILIYVWRSTGPATPMGNPETIIPEVKDETLLAEATPLSDIPAELSLQQQADLKRLDVKDLLAHDEFFTTYGKILTVNPEAVTQIHAGVYECLATVTVRQGKVQKQLQVTSTYRMVDNHFILTGACY